MYIKLKGSEIHFLVLSNADMWFTEARFVFHSILEADSCSLQYIYFLRFFFHLGCFYANLIHLDMFLRAFVRSI